jgi:hypothetical protein
MAITCRNRTSFSVGIRAEISIGNVRISSSREKYLCIHKIIMDMEFQVQRQKLDLSGRAHLPLQFETGRILYQITQGFRYGLRLDGTVKQVPQISWVTLLNWPGKCILGENQMRTGRNLLRLFPNEN